MTLLLLASTDPLGFMESGRTSDAYLAVAADVLHALRIGGDTDDLLTLFIGAGDRLQAVHAFVAAAVSWWDVDSAGRWTATLAAVS
jgi:hypothetical protein